MIPFTYKKPKPEACDPLGQERRSCRDTELVAAGQRPALVPLPGASSMSVHGGGNNHFSQPLTRNNPPVSLSHVFSQPQGSWRTFPNKSLKDMVPPQVQGKRMDLDQQAHMQDLAWGGCSRHKLGISLARKARPLRFQPSFPISAPQPPNQSTAGQRNLCPTSIQLTPELHRAKRATAISVLKPLPSHIPFRRVHTLHNRPLSPFSSPNSPLPLGVTHIQEGHEWCHKNSEQEPLNIQHLSLTFGKL